MTKEEKLQRRIDFLENEVKLMMHDNNFWEHLTDHIVIAISFTILGFLLCTSFMKCIFFNRIRIDYELQIGITYVLSASALDVNPFNYLLFYLKNIFSHNYR